jgi:hypothetical protein
MLCPAVAGNAPKLTPAPSTLPPDPPLPPQAPPPCPPERGVWLIGFPESKPDVPSVTATVAPVVLTNGEIKRTIPPPPPPLGPVTLPELPPEPPFACIVLPAVLTTEAFEAIITIPPAPPPAPVEPFSPLARINPEFEMPP